MSKTETNLPMVLQQRKMPESNCIYTVGADLCKKRGIGMFVVYNVSTKSFEHMLALNTSSKDDFEKMGKLIGEYFKTTTIYEI